MISVSFGSGLSVGLSLRAVVVRHHSEPQRPLARFRIIRGVL